VLQQDKPLPVWGRSGPEETITVKFASKTVETKADAQGHWLVNLPALAASSQGRPMEVSSSAGEVVTFEDVVVGEVWVCSGQSNMEWPVSNAENADDETANARYPDIRFFDVKNEIAYTPQTDVTGTWVVCSPETTANFSAVAYFFGRHLHQKLHRPVGLISTNWGGSIAEAWTSAGALKKHLPEFSARIDELPQIKANLEKIQDRHLREKAVYQANLNVLYDLEDNWDATAAWTNPRLNDAGWSTIDAPKLWEQAGYPGLDGLVWLRKTIDVPASWAGHDLVLRPGPIDEVAAVWFNGELVGTTGNIRKGDVRDWNQPRDYKVPGKLVTAGKNVIAIRVIDASGGGGLWGEPAETMYITPGADERISLAGEWKIQPQFILPKPPGAPFNPNLPTVIFNKMIAPLAPFAIRGVIWYQGESNADRAQQYRTLLPTLIADWRSRWNDSFPFLIVQLANFRERNPQPTESDWASLREAQAMTAANDPLNGLAVAIDIGEANDIHPKSKQEVGRRLGLVAEKIAYGKNVAASGPVFSTMTVEGNEAVLRFNHTHGGLVSAGEKITGFAIKGETGNFVWADARIDGDTIRVSAGGVDKPVAVRYAWADNPEASLSNKAGLPMVPFRTDAP
jgi:sialate O-acetylesterase